MVTTLPSAALSGVDAFRVDVQVDVAGGLPQYTVVGLAASLANSFGFRPLFFWQPTIFGKPKLVSVERDEVHSFAWAEEMFRQVHARIASSSQLKADTAFRDLSEIFAESEGLVFIDYCHITEQANARIASLMADGVIQAFERATPSGRNRVPQGGGPAAQGVN